MSLLDKVIRQQERAMRREYERSIAGLFVSHSDLEESVTFAQWARYTAPIEKSFYVNPYQIKEYLVTDQMTNGELDRVSSSMQYNRTPNGMVILGADTIERLIKQARRANDATHAGIDALRQQVRDKADAIDAQVRAVDRVARERDQARDEIDELKIERDIARAELAKINSRLDAFRAALKGL